MKKLNQKEAVFKAVKKALDVEFVDFIGKCSITKEDKKKAKDILIFGLFNGKIEWSNKNPSMSEITKYASGLLSNWIRKDKRFV